MLLSFNWLKKYVKLPDSVSPEEVADKLKLSTVEVEKVENLGKGLENVVVGKVASCVKHPNADKLKVCVVDIGTEKLNVVCGGSNVAEGMLVALAKVSAKVRWHGEGDLVELKPTKIRGVESRGMICAAEEIGLGEMFPKKDEKEILDLSVIGGIAASARTSLPPATSAGRRNDKLVGKPLSEALGLGDVIIEIDNKSLSNRPDLWGHYGIAREVAALFSKKLIEHKVKNIKEGKEVALKVEVEDFTLCPRYMAVALSGVKIADSPEWLRQSLNAVGLRPVNNIVDITNYIMLDLGQPMHAFDASRVGNSKSETLNPKIIVRRAKDGEEFVALDGQKHKLISSDLLIATPDRAIALAGIIGGEESGISNNTTDIIFESANFNAVSIRKTSTRLGLRTDSSMRFEKSLDPNLCEQALRRAVELTVQICPGAKVKSAVVDAKNFVLPVGPIEAPLSVFRSKLGVDIPAKNIINILERLGFQVKTKKDILSVRVPTWRATKDISITEDIVEEVARIYGYDNISAGLPSFPIAPPAVNPVRQLERTIAGVLVEELAYTEVYNYSFVSAAQVAKLEDDLEKYVQLDNPLSKEKPYLRRNLLPNLLENVKANLDDRQQLKIFEIGKVFMADETGLRAKANSDELLPKQDTWLTAVYVDKKDAIPYWAARRAAERIFESLKQDWKIEPLDKVCSWEHPTRLNLFSCGGKVVGVVHELNPAVAAKHGIAARLGVLKINLSALADCLIGAKVNLYAPFSPYPEAVRDLAFLVKKEVAHADIVAALSNFDPLLKKLEVFDVYEGSNIGFGYKSMAYRLTYASPDRTLTTEEAEKAQKKAAEILKKKFGAEIRS